VKYKDYYEILGVDKKAPQDEIKKAYRKLAKKYHPDTHPGDKQGEEKFKEANEAYEVIGDQEKRKKYEQLGKAGEFRNGSNFDPSQYGFGNAGNNVRYEYRTTGEEGGADGGFSDFFNAFFGGSRFGAEDIFGGGRGQKSAFSRRTRKKGEDIETSIEVTPEECFLGMEKLITIRTGTSDKTISFKIPPGIKNGEKIKLSGQGNSGMNGGQNGDLYLKVDFRPSPAFELDGMDLKATMDLFPWEAALGTEKNFDTIDGRIAVKVPPGIQTDSRIRAAQKGYKDKAGKRGDLYIRIRIMNPASLSKNQRDLYTKLSQGV